MAVHQNYTLMVASTLNILMRVVKLKITLMDMAKYCNVFFNSLCEEEIDAVKLG